MRYLMILLVPVLTACSSAQGYFAGAAPSTVHVGGAVFEVRQRGNLAEAIRINPQYAPRLGPLRAQAAEAMELVSGCAVKAILGDQAVMTGILICEDRPG